MPTGEILFTVAIVSAVSAKSAVAELSWELTTTRSSLPSPLKSAAATDVEPVSAAGPAAAVKVPSPLPIRIVTLLLPALATARSGTPSPLKSATAMELGAVPVAGLAAGVKVPSPLPSRIVTLLLPELATAKSSLPSPLKSAAAIDEGPAPVAGIADTAVRPPPLFRKMFTPFAAEFVTARSGWPSPLKSPTAIDWKPKNGKGGWGPEGCIKVPSPLPNRIRSELHGDSSTLAQVSTRSSLPSPLKSAAAIELDVTVPLLFPKLPFAMVKVPSPLPRSTSLLPSSKAGATARSGMPSPLKSPTAIAPGKSDEGLGAAVNVPSPLPRRTEMVSFPSMTRSGIPSPLKSAVKTVLPLFCEVTVKSEEPAKPAPASLVNADVPSTAFPLLASTNDTVPVGKVFSLPGTVAVNEKMFGTPLASRYVVVAICPVPCEAVTVSDDAVVALGPRPAGSARTAV